MSYTFTEHRLGMQPILTTSTVQQHPIGTKARATHATFGECEFIYLNGLASTQAQELVIYDTRALTTKRAVAGDRGPAAVAMSANVANQFGWYQIHGSVAIRASAAAADGAMFLTATAGTTSNTVVAGDRVDNVRFKTATGTPVAGQAIAQLAYPSLNGAG